MNSKIKFDNILQATRMADTVLTNQTLNETISIDGTVIFAQGENYGTNKED